MTERTYDDIAEWYNAWVGTHSMSEDPYFPVVQALMGEIAGFPSFTRAITRCGQARSRPPKGRHGRSQATSPKATGGLMPAPAHRGRSGPTTGP